MLFLLFDTLPKASYVNCYVYKCNVFSYVYNFYCSLLFHVKMSRTALFILSLCLNYVCLNVLIAVFVIKYWFKRRRFVSYIVSVRNFSFERQTAYDFEVYIRTCIRYILLFLVYTGAKEFLQFIEHPALRISISANSAL